MRGKLVQQFKKYLQAIVKHLFNPPSIYENYLNVNDVLMHKLNKKISHFE